MTARERPKDMLCALELLPGRDGGNPGEHLPSHGNELLADQHSEKTHQGDDRRCGGTDVEEAVDDADQQANTKCHQIGFQ